MKQKGNTALYIILSFISANFLGLGAKPNKLGDQPKCNYQ